MKKNTRKDKRRYLMWSLILTVIVLYLGVFTYNYWTKILINQQTQRELTDKYESLLAEEETLNSELNKLQDPDYVAKFAREKYMYSKDGEVIIRITED